MTSNIPVGFIKPDGWMARRLVYIVLLVAVALVSRAQTMVYLERAANLSFDQERIADAQILRGNVVFRHEEALM